MKSFASLPLGVDEEDGIKMQSTGNLRMANMKGDADEAQMGAPLVLKGLINEPSLVRPVLIRVRRDMPRTKEGNLSCSMGMGVWVSSSPSIKVSSSSLQAQGRGVTLIFLTKMVRMGLENWPILIK